MATITPPSLPPLIINGSKSHKYVMTYTNTWNSELKQSRRSKGTSVGKAIAVEGREGCYELIFNEDFVAKNPGLEQFKVFRCKGGKLEFKVIDEENKTLDTVRAVKKLHGGATWSLQQLIKDSAFRRALKRVFSRQALDRKLLSLAYYLVLNADSALCNYEEFAECTWLPYQKPLTGSATSRILNSISDDDIARFLTVLHEEYRKENKDGLNKHTFYAFDSTSITTQAEIATAAFGHNKDLVPLPQVNILMLVDQKTGLPVYYRQFDGSVPDVKTVRNTIADLARLQITKSSIVLVSDKGYTSTENIDDYLRNNISFICNCRVNANGFAKELALENYAELLDWRNGSSFLGQTVKTIRTQWRYESMPVDGKRALKKDHAPVYVHIYYDEKINQDCCRVLKENLLKIVEKFNTTPKLISKAEQQYIDLYTELKDGKAEIQMYKVNNALKLKGVRVLISDTISDPIEAYVAYEDRNQVEYAFNTIKSRLSCNRVRVHSYEQFNSKIFLQVLASFIAITVRQKVKDWNAKAIKNKAQYNVVYDSDYKLLAKLNNVMMTSFKDGWYFDEIVGKKRELFTILNVPIPSAEQNIEEGTICEDKERNNETPEEEKIGSVVDTL